MITTTRFLCFVSLKKNPISSSYVSMVLVMMDSFWINLWNSTQPFLFHNITVPSVNLYVPVFFLFFFFVSSVFVIVFRMPNSFGSVIIFPFFLFLYVFCSLCLNVFQSILLSSIIDEQKTQTKSSIINEKTELKSKVIWIWI